MEMDSESYPFLPITKARRKSIENREADFSWEKSRNSA